jgi:hypothetical protein
MASYTRFAEAEGMPLQHVLVVVDVGQHQPAVQGQGGDGQQRGQRIVVEDQGPEHGADVDRRDHAQGRRQQDSGEDQGPGGQLDGHGHVEQAAVGQRGHQLDGERLVADRLGIERQKEMVDAVGQHPGAEHHAPDQDEMLHRQAPAGWAVVGAGGAPKVVRGLANSTNIER